MFPVTGQMGEGRAGGALARWRGVYAWGVGGASGNGGAVDSGSLLPL